MNQRKPMTGRMSKTRWAAFLFTWFAASFLLWAVVIRVIPLPPPLPAGHITHKQ